MPVRIALTFVLAVAASAATLATSVLPAKAAEVQVQTVNVPYGDIDLANNEGVARLNTRIAHAAELACGPVDRRNLEQSSRFNACRTAAIDTARPRMDALVASANMASTQSAMARPVKSDMH